MLFIQENQYLQSKLHKSQRTSLKNAFRLSKKIGWVGNKHFSIDFSSNFQESQNNKIQVKTSKIWAVINSILIINVNR